MTVSLPSEQRQVKAIPAVREVRQSTMSFLRPRINVIVVNYNYERFIGETIDSIRSQTYTDFDCIVVDNASTDNSIDVARRHIGDDPRFKILQLQANLGHLGGGLRGLALATHEFVCFVDSDDVLFPSFLAFHLQVHLSVRGSVSLTNSNMVEIDAEGSLLDNGVPFFADVPGLWSASMRDPDAAPRVAAVEDREYQKLVQEARYANNGISGWHWAPGTSSMYRRSVVRLLAKNAPDGALFGGVDAFFNHVCQATTGSVLISIPLSARRLHGKNDYATMPYTTGLLTGTHVANDIALVVRVLAMKILIANVKENSEIVPHGVFFNMFVHLPNVSSEKRPGFLKRLVPELQRHYPEMVAAYGERTVLLGLNDQLPRRMMRQVVFGSQGRIFWRMSKVVRLHAGYKLRRLTQRLFRAFKF